MSSEISTPTNSGADTTNGAADSQDVATSGKVDTQAEVLRLSQLSPIAYDREREAAAEKLGCRVKALDDEVKAARAGSDARHMQGRTVELPEPNLWPEAVEGKDLLGELSSTIRQYAVLTEEQVDAVALFAIHTHAHDAADTSPKLVFKSAQKRSGKTRMMEIMQRICAGPLLTSGIKPAALLRLIEMQAPTVLLDEIDAAMKGDGELAEALRGLLNAGFNRSAARLILTVPAPGGGYEPREFSAWAPQVLAGIGNLPDTVRDRSIEIEMVRKRTDEKVKPLRRRDGQDLDQLQRKVARWASDHFHELQNARPAMPVELGDRAADAWEPLIAIADLAEGAWPERARAAARKLSGNGAVEDDNIGSQLLTDIRIVFSSPETREYAGDKVITSEDLTKKLIAMEGHLWAEMGQAAKPLTQNKLASLLKEYKIRPATVRFGSGEKDTKKGYKLAQFEDAFTRYLPPMQAVTPSQGAEPLDGRTESDTSQLELCDESFSSPIPSNTAGCDDVTVQSSEEEGPWKMRARA